MKYKTNRLTLDPKENKNISDSKRGAYQLQRIIITRLSLLILFKPQSCVLRTILLHLIQKHSTMLQSACHVKSFLHTKVSPKAC